MQTYCGICIDRLPRIAPCAREPLGKRVNRVGLTVSKRLGGAVVRSRVRRILRAAYRQLEAEQNIKKGKLIVIGRQRGGVQREKHRYLQGSAFMPPKSCRYTPAAIPRGTDKDRNVPPAVKRRHRKNETNRNFFRKALSKAYLASEAALLQVSTDLLELRDRGIPRMGIFYRIRTYGVAHPALQSLLQGRL